VALTATSRFDDADEFVGFALDSAKRMQGLIIFYSVRAAASAGVFHARVTLAPWTRFGSFEQFKPSGVS
jgi:hypothetical protein